MHTQLSLKLTYPGFNVSTSFTNLNILNISGLPSTPFSIIVGIEIFSNKAEQTSPKGETLLTKVLAHGGSTKNGK